MEKLNSMAHEFSIKFIEYLELLIAKLKTYLINFNKWLLSFFSAVYLVVLLSVLVAFTPFAMRYAFFSSSSQKEPVVSEDKVSTSIEKLDKDYKKLEKKLVTKTPKSYYLVINSASNTFSLYKGTELIKKDKCSTGSYILLKNGDEQEWMFKTPKGEFSIRGKTTAPVWKKPDWAFVEEGLPVPSMNHHTRYEYGVLGDYALNLGQGYLIHGTLYQRFLGLPVTHGCIRLNDANLELVYNSLSGGSKVYIY